MNVLRARLEELREMFYDGPKESTWWALCALFEQWTDDGADVALDYALQQLTRWPDGRRVAPERWLFEPAEAARAWPLARSVVVAPQSFSGHRERRPSPTLLLRSPQISGITHLSLTTGLNAPFEELARSPHAGQIRHLELGPSEIGPGCMAVLADPGAALRLESLTLASRQEVDRALYETMASARVLEGLRALNLKSGINTDEGALRPLVDGPIFSGLRHLGLSKSLLLSSGLESLLSHITLNQLDSLSLDMLKMETEGAALLADSGVMRGLRRLEVTHNAVKGDGVVALMAASREGLSALDVSNNQMGDDASREVMAFYPGGPPTLAVRANGLGDACCEAMASAEGLLDLDLTSNEIRIRGVRDLLESRSLVALNLSHNRIGDVSLPPSMVGGESLRELVLRHNRLGDQTVDFLASCPQLLNLRALDLSHNLIRVAGVKALRRLSGLESLDLSHNKIADDGLRSLSAAKLTGLRHLSLACNPIGLGGLGALLASEALTGLRTLDLRKVPIGRKGARLLANAPWSEQLEELKVSIELVGPVGLRHLRQSTKLSLSARANLLGRERGWGAR